MSTRYVWELYSIHHTVVSNLVYGVLFHNDSFPIHAYESYTIKPAEEGGETHSYFSPSGDMTTITKDLVGNAAKYRYLFPHKSVLSGGAHFIFEHKENTEITDAWCPVNTDGTDSTERTIYVSTKRTPSDILNNHKHFFRVHLESKAGNIKKGYKSYDQKLYPDDGESGSSWYKYLGYDRIDPSSVQYSKSDLEAGEPVTISITPVTPTYGGTISYQYQYSLNGGSTWTNIDSKTIETSAAFTIPEGAKQFQARVTASDNWGFTSATYVYGHNLPVSQIKAYATVNGKNRAGAKIYATVNGKIRQVQKGYVSVGGKIRKLF